MTAHRVRRILAILALAGAIASPPHSQLAARASAAPAPPRIRSDSIAIDFPHFSPNGDNHRDIVRFTYFLNESAYVKVWVHAPGISDTLAILASDSLPIPPGRPSVTWNGRSSQGVLLPDADYVVEFTGHTVAGSRPISNQRTVTIDTQAPAVEILEFLPTVYTPTVAGTPANLRVKVRTSTFVAGDSLVIVTRRKTGTAIQEFRLQLLGTVAGSGDYLAQCDSCAKSSFPDTIYQVDARVFDAAANADTAHGSFDKDIRGPSVVFLHPQLPSGPVHNLAVQYADSIRAIAKDRHGVQGVRVRITPAGDSTRTYPASPRPAGTDYGFAFDLSQLLAAEGTYTVVVVPQDTYGVPDSVTLRYDIDRTLPPKPTLAPPPGPVSKLEQISVELLVDSTAAVRVERTGGAAPTESRPVTHPRISFVVQLRPGANHLGFTAFDGVGNASPAETTTVVWDTSFGMAVPERFHAGNRIELEVGPAAARGAQVRIYATDGTLVQKFEFTGSQFVYSFPWDLRTPEGHQVKNGAYLVEGIVYYTSGSTERHRKLIAVLE